MQEQDDGRDQAGVQTIEHTTEAPTVRKPRGFATMDPKIVSELAKRGGKAAHVAGRAHEFTSDEARAAGRKGGLASHAKRLARRADALATKS
jgi:general stress protein YciG